MKVKGILSVENIVFFILLSVCVIVISVETNRTLAFFTRITGTFQNVQLWASETTRTVSEGVKDFSTLFAAKEENKRMAAKMKDLVAQERRITNLQKENDILRKQLNLPQRMRYGGVHAEVLARDLNNFFGTLVISRGKNDGVKKGMVVIAYNLQQELYGLVGRVSEVYDKTSQVRLSFDSQFHVGAKVEKNNITGLFSGGGDPVKYGILNYVNVNNLANLAINDLVVTNGMDDTSLTYEERQLLYPSGIYIGRIKAINLISYQASLQVEMSSAVDFSSLEHVIIVTKR
ncbi:MAG: rod shape-determining protein MreC [Spirochaetia bacterium]